MGTRYRAYLGPFLVVKPKMFDKTVREWRCPRKTCNKVYSESFQFCPQHGDRLQMIDRSTSADKVNELLYSDEFADRLYHPDGLEEIDRLTLLPNQNGLGRFAEEDGQVIPILDSQSIFQNGESETFMEIHLDLIDALRPVSESVEVCWGLVTYWS